MKTPLADRRVTSAWIVPLVGHEFDLEDLPIYLQGAAITVAKREGTYFLVLPSSLTGPTHKPVVPLAHEYIAQINGAASFVLDAYRPIAIAEGAYYGIDQHGEVAHTVIPVGTAEIRCKGGHMTMLVNGVRQPDLRVGQIARVLSAAAESTAATDALVLVGRASPSWSELYLVYELVESNSGARMIRDRWITRTDAERFTRTANSYTALGRAARHGKDQSQAPKEPMSQSAAKKLMRQLVHAWLLAPAEA